MGDILDEASALIECKECPWYKSCVLPIRVSAEEMRRQFESSMPGASPPGMPASGMSQFLAGLASAAQNSILEGCPIFIARLRADPGLAQKIRKLMQTWGMEEDAR